MNLNLFSLVPIYPTRSIFMDVTASTITTIVGGRGQLCDWRKKKNTHIHTHIKLNMFYLILVVFSTDDLHV